MTASDAVANPASQDALSIVGRGLIAWLADHGPATTNVIVANYAEPVVNANEHLEALRVITAELRHLESLGAVRRVPYTNGAARSVMWAALPLVEAGHVVDISNDGWAIQHPLECRPNMLDCDLHRRFKAWMDEIDGPPAEPGRYMVTGDLDLIPVAQP